MSLSSKVLLPITVLLFIFVSVFIYSFYYFSTTKRELEKEIARIDKVTDLAMQTAVLRQQSRFAVLNYRLTLDDTYLTTIEHINEDTNIYIAELNTLIKTSTGKTLLKEFEGSREEVMKEREVMVTAIQNNDTEKVDKIFQIWNIKSDNNYASLLDFISYNQQLSDMTTHFYEDLMNTTFIFLMVFTVIMAILIITLFFYLRRTITIPLMKLSLVAKSITGGNFELHHFIQSNDEIGILSHNLEVMSKKLEAHQKRLVADVSKKEAQLKKLKEFEAQKDNFISTASHELKSPVTSLKIFEQLLKKEITKNKHYQYDVYLKKMDEQTDKLTRLIVSLLEVAKMQIGRLPFNMDYFDLNKTVDDVVYIIKKRSKKHTIVTKGKLKNKVYGDKDRITQVLDNLMSNAVKYSPDNKKIVINLKPGKTYTSVSVQDFGIGIDKKHHRKIFNRFYRVNGMDENTYPGLGIGLYISTEIIKQHKGRMWVKSSKGKGSIFGFTLPYQPPINKKLKDK